MVFANEIKPSTRERLRNCARHKHRAKRFDLISMSKEHVWAILECTGGGYSNTCQVHFHSNSGSYSTAKSIRATTTKFVVFCDDYSVLKWSVNAPQRPAKDDKLVLYNMWSFEDNEFVRRARFVLDEAHTVLATFELGAFEDVDERARLIQLMRHPVMSFDAASEKVVAFDRMLCRALDEDGHLPLWHKICCDRSVTYGDGGFSDLKFPVLASGSALALSAAKRTALVDELHKLGEERGDYHEREPVLDIIDPALHALLLGIANADDTSVGSLDAQRQLATLREGVAQKTCTCCRVPVRLR
jgi:hypothetical protein